MLDDIHDNLVLFLQCALFTILKAHGVYPAGAFARQRLLGHLSWWGVCPEVERYVTRLCDSLRPSLCRESLHRLKLVRSRRRESRRSSESDGHGGDGGRAELNAVIVELGEEAVKRLEALGQDKLCRSFGLALLRLETFLAATSPVRQDSPPMPDSSDMATWIVEVQMRGTGTDIAAPERSKVLGPCWDMPQKRRRTAGQCREEEKVFHPLATITAALPQSSRSSGSAGSASGGATAAGAALSVYVEMVRR